MSTECPPARSRAPLVAGVVAPVALLGLTGKPGVWLGKSLIGAGTADMWGHAWGYWWTARAVVQGHLPFFHAPVNHPDPQTWWVIDLPVATLLAPVTHLLGAAAAYNLAFALHAAVGAASLAALVIRRGGPGWVAGLAGVLAATSPFARGALVSGVPEALAVLLVPLLVLLLDQALAGAHRRQLAAAAALSAVLVLDGAYSAIAGALAGAAAVGAALWSQKDRGWVLGRAAVVAAPAAIALGGLRLALMKSKHPAMDNAQERMVDIGAAWVLQPLSGTDLMSWSTPAQLLSSMQAEPETPHRHIVYIGVLLPVFLALAAWKHPPARRPAFIAFMAAVLALGPALYVFGTAYTPAVLPGTWLWMAGATNLYRLAGLVPVVGLLALACVRHRLMPVAMVAVAVEWLVGTPLPLQLPTTPNPAGTVENWIAEQPIEGAVIDLPFDREGSGARGPWPQRPFFLQTAHQRPIASALYRPTEVTKHSRAISAFDRSITRAWQQEAVPEGGAAPLRAARIPRPLEPDQLDGLNAKVSRVGYRWLVLDLELVMPNQRADALAWVTVWLGTPELTSEDEMRLVWSIPDVAPPSGPPALRE